MTWDDAALCIKDAEDQSFVVEREVLEWVSQAEAENFPALTSARDDAGMFGEVAMAEPWDGVGKAAMAGTHKALEGASGWVRCSR
jgi:hypothetical protein